MPRMTKHQRYVLDKIAEALGVRDAVHLTLTQLLLNLASAAGVHIETDVIKDMDKRYRGAGDEREESD